MANTILPNGEELHVTPAEIKRYLNPDGLRQLLRQERMRWQLKLNRDCDYYDNSRLYKYSTEVHNEGYYQRMELRTFPDNGAYAGYAGINIDSGFFGITHNLDKWDKSISNDSLRMIVNRTMIGAMAKIPDKPGFGLDDANNMIADSINRISAILFDPYDGRAYLYSNDDPMYVNNETRSAETKIPDRTVARIGDIPTRVTQLINDLDFVSDPDYKHTDNNFTNSERFLIDNMDDRTFVYPEIAKDANGEYIKNIRVGLNGIPGYDEGDGLNRQNTQPDMGIDENNPNGDRDTSAVNAYNYNGSFSGVIHGAGYLPGIFKSIDELEKVDLIGQRMLPSTHRDAPGAKRTSSYYLLDGRWSSNWFDRLTHPDSYLAQSLNPNNMEIRVDNQEPTPYTDADQVNEFDKSQLYQWRYNRIDIKYQAEDIRIDIIESGVNYSIGDILRWSFGDDLFIYRVTAVGSNGQIQSGEYVPHINNVYDQDPSTHGVGIEFTNMSSVGHGAKLAIVSRPTIISHSTQIKNNLYAYVDVTPTVRSDNTTPWSDIHEVDPQGGKIGIRSTAAGPAFSGINSGRGGRAPSPNQSASTLYEHGGNATAGVHVHLFRYVIDTENPTWVIKDGVQIFTGRWVDQGPMGLERPSDIKALLFSNSDCNNFNNYYKFMVDLLFDSMNRNPDGVTTNNPNAICMPYFHIDQKDPDENTKFTETRVDPETSKLIEVDVTPRVWYFNAATGVMFAYSSSTKNDSEYGYGHRSPGWVPIAGAISR